MPGPLEQQNWWLDRPDLHFGVGGDEALEGWLGGEAVESLAQVCQSRIDAFYERLTGPGEQPRYFVEKYLPFQLAPDLLAEMYPGAREVILVRDFRDMLCSIIAFNRKRGYEAFGRAEAGSDAEYVETTVANSARRLLRRLRDRGEAAHLVRYEDLIQEPAATLEAMMRFLGLDVERGGGRGDARAGRVGVAGRTPDDRQGLRFDRPLEAGSLARSRRGLRRGARPGPDRVRLRADARRLGGLTAPWAEWW